MAHLLEIPALYRLSQLLLAPGAEQLLHRRIQQLAAALPAAGSLLDVGCGPSSWLWKLGAHPVGLDLSHPYSAAFSRRQEPAVTGSALALPFADHTFEGVWNIGVLHHLPDDLARLAIQEMLRVRTPGGYVVILDAVLPHSPWTRSLATLIRRLDRGQFMRSQAQLAALLPELAKWSMRRYTYAATGLEMLESVFIGE